jgi:ferrochelatase
MSDTHFHASDTPFDALLVVSFGGPESRDDVLPFLERVLRGRNVPQERMYEVAEHYYHVGGASPINTQVRELIAALRRELDSHGIHLPVYWGNRNWHPLLPDAVRQMAADGVRRALAYVTSAFSSYSGCRQYLENIEAARVDVGPSAPEIDKLRVFYNHPGFVAATAAQVRAAWSKLPAARAAEATILFTAHSIPLRMACGCDYVMQLEETSSLVGQALGTTRWRLVYQSRSGPPSQPWLEPDICGALRRLGEEAPGTDVVIAPIGFLSDHVEVLYDLDVEAQAVCDELGLNMVRAATVGKNPRFVQMIRELIEERLGLSGRQAIGRYGASPDVCPPGCCLYPMAANPTASGGR